MMKRIVAILCSLALCTFFLSACGNKADGAMEPVQDENGSVTGYERVYHNDNGDITRWDVYDVNQKYDHYVLYEYDSNGKMTLFLLPIHLFLQAENSVQTSIQYTNITKLF